MPSESETHNRYQPVGLGAGTMALLMALLWGGNSVATKGAADFLPPLAVGGARFLIASLFLWPYLVWQRSVIRLEPGQWRPAILLGVLLFLQIWTFNLGVDYSNSSHATVLINTFIFWVAIIEHFITRTVRLHWWQGVGLLVAAVGVVLCVWSSTQDEPSVVQASTFTGTLSTTVALDQPTLGGDIIMAISALILAIKVIYTRAAVHAVPSDRLILWHNVIGALLFIAASPLIDDWTRSGLEAKNSTEFTVSLAAESAGNATSVSPLSMNSDIVASGWWGLLQRMSWEAWGGLLYSGLVVSGFCFVMHAWLLRSHSASHISVFSFATPLCGVVLAVLMRGDSLTLWMLASGLCIALSIALVNWPSPKSPLPPSEPAA